MAVPKISGLGYYRHKNVSGAGGFPSTATAGQGVGGAPVHDGTVITDKLKIGSTTLEEIRHGSTYVHTVYKGSNVVWHKPELTLPADVVVYIPFNGTVGSAPSSAITVYTSPVGSTEATENIGWLTFGSNNTRTFASSSGTNPVGHTTSLDMNNTGGALTFPSSFLSTQQNLTTNISIEFYLYTQSNSFNVGSYGAYFTQGGWSHTGYGWTMENYSGNDDARPRPLTEYGYQSNRFGGSYVHLADNTWHHFYQGVDIANGRYLHLINGGTSSVSGNRGQYATLESWSPTVNMQLFGGFRNGQASELIMRINDPDWGTKYSNNGFTPPTTPLIS